MFFFKLLQCYILQIYLVGVCVIDARSWVGGTTDRYRAQKTQKVLKKQRNHRDYSCTISGNLGL